MLLQAFRPARGLSHPVLKARDPVSVARMRLFLLVDQFQRGDGGVLVRHQHLADPAA